MPRNALLERQRSATLALARGASDPPPVIDNVDNMRTAHDVRRLCQCSHCNGLGDRDQMICAPVPYHTRCFRQAFGFELVLELPAAQSGKFRISDLSAKEMRRLLLRLTRKPDAYVRQAKKL